MQRFKNLTKKSGKVASAILSAAMVTSMVLGTNVVEVKAAQNDDAETETNVQATTSSAITVNQDYEAVQAAKTALVGEISKFSINTATTGTETGFEAAADGVDLKYRTNTSEGTIVITKKPTKKDAGTAEYRTTIAKGDYSTPVVVTYTLDSISTRAEKAQKAVEEVLAKELPATNLFGKTGYGFEIDDIKKLAETAIKKNGDFIEDKNGIKEFSDITIVEAKDLNLKAATADKTGEADVTVVVQAGYESITVDKDAEYSKTVDTNTTRVNNAKKSSRCLLTVRRF